MAARGRQSIHAGGEKTHDVKLSKNLAYLLRHGAVKEGLHIDDSGFVRVDEILKIPKLKYYSLEDVRRVVTNNDKQRFALKEDPDTQTTYIRANQGHTLDVEKLELTELDPDKTPVAIHGTYSKFIKSINSTGLSKMQRQHIHMAPGLPGDSGVISGMRKTCDQHIYISVKRAAGDGIKFYRSANGVILSPGNENGVILPKYFKDIVKPAAMT